MNLFADTEIDPDVVRSLASRGITRENELQSATIPFGHLGFDFVAATKEGSGRTVSIAVIARLRPDERALVFCRTSDTARRLMSNFKDLGVKNVQVITPEFLLRRRGKPYDAHDIVVVYDFVEDFPDEWYKIFDVVPSRKQTNVYCRSPGTFEAIRPFFPNPPDEIVA